MAEHVDIQGDATKGFHLVDDKTGRSIARYNTLAKVKAARDAWVKGTNLPPTEEDDEAATAKAAEDAKKKADADAAAKAAKVQQKAAGEKSVRQVAWTPRGDPAQNREALEHRKNVAAIAASEPPADPTPQAELRRLVAIPPKMRTPQQRAKIAELQAQVAQ
jgi:hypothetical protein